MRCWVLPNELCVIKHPFKRLVARHGSRGGGERLGGGGGERLGGGEGGRLGGGEGERLGGGEGERSGGGEGEAVGGQPEQQQVTCLVSTPLVVLQLMDLPANVSNALPQPPASAPRTLVLLTCLPPVLNQTRRAGSAIVMHEGKEITPPTCARVPGPFATAIRVAADRAVVAVLHLVGCSACGPTAGRSGAACLAEGGLELQQQERELRLNTRRPAALLRQLAQANQGTATHSFWAWAPEPGGC